MPAVQVTVESVERCVPTERLIAHFGIDGPVATERTEGHFLLVAGWVLCADGVQTCGVEVRDDGRLIKRASIIVPRPDVLEALQRSDLASDRIGFYFEIGTLGLGERFTLDVDVLVGESIEQARPVRICRVTGRKASHFAAECRYRPVQVTSLGRSGTTLLMGALAQHPDVLVTNFYPYELGQANYWLHVLMVASAPADFEGSTHPDRYANTIFSIGHNPYSHPSYLNQYRSHEEARAYYTDSTLRALARFCIDRIDAYYDLVARQEEKPRARIFAEKAVPGFVQNVCRDVYVASREVILVRDFRDVFCSAKAFNAKRDTRSFGRDQVQDDLEWIDAFFVPGARELYKAWQCRKASVLLVRYEDLVLDPLDQLGRLFGYLEITGDEGLKRRIVESVFSRTDSAVAHGTTASPEASIGRWREELCPELRSHFRQSLGDVLEAFGYD